jgi:molybdate transport system substrate-binding protein
VATGARRTACLSVAVALAWMGAIGGASAATPPPITVLAASSLTDALPALDGREHYSFSGSNALATQIANGAPADVFASANTALPASLYARGLVEKPVHFTRNALVIVVPKANPAKIETVEDLTKPGVSIDIANAAVPVGSYTLSILKNLALTQKVLPNVVSEETDVRTVLTKVALGQADAGFVYATDAKTVGTRVTVITLPPRAQPNVTYSIAVVTGSSDQAAAHAFVNRVLAKSGQAKLRAFGFLPLSSAG